MYQNAQILKLNSKEFISKILAKSKVTLLSNHLVPNSFGVLVWIKPDSN